MWICHILIIHSPIDGYLGCLHLVVINSAAMNFHTQVFVWTYVFILGGIYLVAYCEIARSHGNSVQLVEEL